MGSTDEPNIARGETTVGFADGEVLDDSCSTLTPVWFLRRGPG
jgi:hypothetical protein